MSKVMDVTPPTSEEFNGTSTPPPPLPCSQEKKRANMNNTLDLLTVMSELKSIVLQRYGAENLDSMPVTWWTKVLTKIMGNCTKDELTLTVLVPMTVLLVPEHMWSEMTCPRRWRLHYRAQIYWTTNPDRESEYQKLLEWMNEKSTAPLARWQTGWLPSYGEAMCGTYLTYLSQAELGQLIELLRTYVLACTTSAPKVCMSSASMETTSTLHTAVRTAREPVDVASWSIPPPINYVDDDEFDKMFESYGSTKRTGPTYLNTYVHRPASSKKWAAPTLMEDYVIDIHIYEYLLQLLFKRSDNLYGIENNRYLSYIRTGLPGRNHIRPTRAQCYWSDTREYLLSMDMLEYYCRDHFVNNQFYCLENILPMYKTDNVQSLFKSYMMKPVDRYTSHCDTCKFKHNKITTVDEVRKNYPLLNDYTISLIVNNQCSLIVNRKSKIEHLDPNDWWKHAYCRVRGSFAQNSPYVKMAKTVQQEQFRKLMRMDYKVTDPTSWSGRGKRKSKDSNNRRKKGKWVSDESSNSD
ncbi:Ns1 [Thalictrum thalictroides]|uniref:Ns1 n=1 Tax=Thalictrum thalictroides TaxID=46969 RepID=A0A7J6VDK6_THATH|nr:Ns1 [Thalictrum thalictroides]